MRRREDWFVVAVVALAAACSSPSLSDGGFISLGRNAELDGGSAGYGPTGGVLTTGGVLATGGADVTGGTAFVGMGGTLIPEGGTAGDANGGTSTGADGGTAGDANGGTAGDANGAASTGADGGTPGDADGGTVGGTGGTAGADGGTMGGTGGTAGAYGGTMGVNGGTSTSGQGGTSTGGDGSTCGPGLPTDDGVGPISQVCNPTLQDQRVCLPDDVVVYCGQGISAAALVEQCAPGTCATGCCHTASDPCPTLDPSAYDCAGDCGGNGVCIDASTLSLDLATNALQIVRVGGRQTLGEPCGAGTRRYFRLHMRGPRATRVTVSPPWMLAETFTCADGSNSYCPGSTTGDYFVTVMTDADPPPPRNLVIETSSAILRCSP